LREKKLFSSCFRNSFLPLILLPAFREGAQQISIYEAAEMNETRCTASPLPFRLGKNTPKLNNNKKLFLLFFFGGGTFFASSIFPLSSRDELKTKLSSRAAFWRSAHKYFMEHFSFFCLLPPPPDKQIRKQAEREKRPRQPLTVRCPLFSL
jgi:hypothetical protein